MPVLECPRCHAKIEVVRRAHSKIRVRYNDETYRRCEEVQSRRGTEEEGAWGCETFERFLADNWPSG